jgi:hypothetical protein
MACCRRAARRARGFKQLIFYSPSRHLTNSAILADLFPGSDWSATLRWLHLLDLKPPPFRHNLYPHLNNPDRALAYKTTHLLLKALSRASLPPSDAIADEPPSETSADPLWKLLFLLQALLFCPFRERPSFTYSRCLTSRLHTFHRGQIQRLYDHAYTPRPSRPSRQESDELRAFLNDPDLVLDDDDATAPVSVSHRNALKAQSLADLDEYGRAFKTLKQDTPVATLDAPTIQHIEDTLYPRPYPKHHPDSQPTPYNTRSRSRCHQRTALTLRDQPLLKALRSVQKGTAAGPFADYTDFFRNMALYETKRDADTTSRPYLQTFADTVQLLLDGSISPAIASSFRSTYFLALHKSPTDPLKLRPIGIGLCCPPPSSRPVGRRRAWRH